MQGSDDKGKGVIAAPDDDGGCSGASEYEGVPGDEEHELD